jgi:hypothetical protein
VPDEAADDMDNRARRHHGDRRRMKANGPCRR